MFSRPQLLERLTCALVLLALAPRAGTLCAQGQPQAGENASGYPYLLSSWTVDRGHSVRPIPAAVDNGAWEGTLPQAGRTQLVEPTSAGETWIASPADTSPYLDAEIYATDGRYPRRPVIHSYPEHEVWFWELLPEGLIYRSYQAGVHEPRLGVVLFREGGGRSFWDAAMGGRVGLLRYGNGDPLRPQGWQLDFEGAALMRLTLDDMRDMETADYRAGVPLTYGIRNWQFKFAYYHLSAHLADEFAIRNPGSLNDRINYVRDALVVGASYYPHPAWRLYSEAGYAFNADGGAEPWEFQFGSEFSRPGPTGPHGTPFLALNGHLREEHSFGGDFTAQLGWLWRGGSGQVMRLGFHYFNGKSSQFQTFRKFEEQVGAGVWYDF